MSITESQLAAKFKASGRNWDQLCQAGIVNASIWSGGFVGTYPSAIAAYHASHIESKDASKAPVGAVHFWDIGKYGHTAGQLAGGKIFMCSKYIDHAWGRNVGTTTVAAYTKKTGARYLGWSKTNGKNKLYIKTAAAPKPAAKPAAKPSSGVTFALPSQSVQIRVQRALARHGFYHGPLDGDMEKMSKIGVQKAVKKFAGYTGLVDGDPKGLTSKAIQKFARSKGGYTGRAKTLDDRTWTAFAIALERTP